MLWVCLHLPHLAVQVFQRGQAANAPLIVRTDPPRADVHACCATAAALGVQPGMRLTTAGALAPLARICPRNTALEAAALAELAAWAGQFSPTLSIAPPDAVLLEIAGSLNLFGGIEALATRLREGMAELGWRGTLAAAPTPGAARLLARAGMQKGIRGAQRLAAALGPLPIGLLDAAAPLQDTLATLGVRTVADCLALPRDGFARRYGPELLDELDRLLGHRADPRPPWQPPPRLQARLVLPWPVAEVEQLVFAARRLLAGLCGGLTAAGLGLLRLRLELQGDDTPDTPLELRLSIPSRDSPHLTALVRERLQHTPLPGRVEALRLQALETAPLAARSQGLFGDPAQAQEDAHALIERLRARLGDAAVSGLAVAADHRPERAWRQAEPGSHGHPPPAPPPSAPPSRPLWLLDPPRPLETHDGRPRLEGPLTLLAGPERIETGWWDGADVRRDYYIARNPRHSRYWIYRDTAGWFLHGVFA